MKNFFKYLIHFIFQILVVLLIWHKQYSDIGDMVNALFYFPLYAYPLSLTIGRWSDFKIMNKRYYDKYILRDISLNFILGGLYLPIHFLISNEFFIIYFILVLVFKNILDIRNVRTLIREMNN